MDPTVFIASGDGIVHSVIVALSGLIFLISVLAYAKKRNPRYLLLSFAFLFLLLSQALTLIETLFMSDNLIVMPLLDIHASHLFDLLMLFSFGLALTNKGSGIPSKRGGADSL